MEITEKAQAAREAQRRYAAAGAEVRAGALANLERLLAEREEEALAANRRDLQSPDNARLPEQLRKRLALSADKMETLREGVRVLRAAPDPVGRPVMRRELDRGLILEKVRAPLGVLLIIFESRPDAVIQIGSLALRTGNAALMKGGSEAEHSNRALTDLLREAAAEAGGDPNVIVNVEGRRAVAELLALDRHIDLVIPRGSAELVRSITDASRIPVLGHADGVCHVYVDAEADPDTAVKVTLDSKTDYAAVCNAAETLLIHRDFPAAPKLIGALQSAGVEVRGDAAVREAAPGVTPAAAGDFGCEFGEMTMAAATVAGWEEAVAHIHRYGSAHTDAIVTENRETAERFLRAVDSASVFWNASTRFADGFRYGLGAEVGIATGRVHARGPVGMEGLLTSKWLLRGSGQGAGDYGPGGRSYTHRDLPLQPAAEPAR